MTGAAMGPPASSELRDEVRALASAVALTAGFTAIYVVVAPLVVLGALVGGPVRAAIVLAREAVLGP